MKAERYGKFLKFSLPTSLPTPPMDFVNAYLVESEPLTLIDTGVNTKECLAALESGLSLAGYRLADIQQVILTHAHQDHFGLAKRVAETNGAKVFAHEDESLKMSDYLAQTRRMGNYFAELFPKAGAPPESLAMWKTVGEYVRSLAEPVQVTDTMKDGDTLKFSSLILEVIHCPGHTAGLICLYDRENRILVSNDHLLSDILTNPLAEPPHPDTNKKNKNLVNYLKSLKKIESLEINVCLPGHGKVFHDFQNVLAKVCRYHAMTKEKVLSSVKNGAGNIYAIAMELTRDTPRRLAFLKVFEALGQLELLEEEGKVVCGEENGLWIYRAV